MKKLLIILFIIVILVLPNQGICEKWKSGFGDEVDNYIRGVAIKHNVPESEIGNNFSFEITTREASTILKVYYKKKSNLKYCKNLRNPPEQKNKQQVYSPSHGYDNPVPNYSGLGGAEQYTANENQEFTEFANSIVEAIKTEDPNKILLAVDELFNDYWWDEFGPDSPCSSCIEILISDFLKNIKELPNMHKVYTTTLTGLTRKKLGATLSSEMGSFYEYIKNDESSDLNEAIQFLESLQTNIHNMSFSHDKARGTSLTAAERYIKALKNLYTGAEEQSEN